jgi:hypothetical protein
MTESPICTWPDGRTGAKTPRATPIESNRSVTQPGAEGTAFRSWLQAAPRRAVAGRCRECPPPLKGAHRFDHATRIHNGADHPKPLWRQRLPGDAAFFSWCGAPSTSRQKASISD